MTDFFRTFRGRLLLILAFLLVATLGVQYYLNLRTQNENNNLRAMQESQGRIENLRAETQASLKDVFETLQRISARRAA